MKEYHLASLLLLNDRTFSTYGVYYHRNEVWLTELFSVHLKILLSVYKYSIILHGVQTNILFLFSSLVVIDQSDKTLSLQVRWSRQGSRIHCLLDLYDERLYYYTLLLLYFIILIIILSTQHWCWVEESPCTRWGNGVPLSFSTFFGFLLFGSVVVKTPSCPDSVRSTYSLVISCIF